MTEPSLFDEEPEPIRPYWQDGEWSSGWSGSDTSKASEPYRLTEQNKAWLRLRDAREVGLTFAELVDVVNADREPGEDKMHHGTASSCLSNLHQAGYAARLTGKRKRRKVYVLPSFVGGRDTEVFVVRKTRKDIAWAAWQKADAVAQTWGEATETKFEEWWRLQ